MFAALDLGTVLDHLSIVLALSICAGVIKLVLHLLRRRQRRLAPPTSAPPASLILVRPDGSPVARANVVNSHGDTVLQSDAYGRIVSPPVGWIRGGSRLHVFADGRGHMVVVEVDANGLPRPITIPDRSSEIAPVG